MSIIGLARVFSPLTEVVVKCIVPAARPPLMDGRSAFCFFSSLPQVCLSLLFLCAETRGSFFHNLEIFSVQFRGAERTSRANFPLFKIPRQWSYSLPVFPILHMSGRNLGSRCTVRRGGGAELPDVSAMLRRRLLLFAATLGISLPCLLSVWPPRDRSTLSRAPPRAAGLESRCPRRPVFCPRQFAVTGSSAQTLPTLSSARQSL